jgi:hypothetical protein
MIAGRMDRKENEMKKKVVSLHIHLDNLARRPDILKSYLEKGMKAAGPDK